MQVSPSVDVTPRVWPSPGGAVAAVRSWVAAHRRLVRMLAVVVAVLAVVFVANRVGPAHTGVLVGPAAAAGLLLLARRHGLSWHELGLSRRTWRRGVLFAVAAVLVVGALFLVAAAWPLTRPAFFDPRYQLDTGGALLTALVFIPLGTVLLEEVAFRGVLLGVVGRHRSHRAGVVVSSVLFGVWHTLPALALSANRLVEVALGGGVPARVALVTGVVVFTGLAGWLMCEVRRRSGSLIATAGLHWATNGLAVLLTSALWAWQVV